MNRLAIYGTGGFAREVLHIAENYVGEQRMLGRPVPLVVFLEDDPEKREPIHGYDVVGLDQAGGGYVVAIADAAVRRKLAQRCDAAGLTATSIWGETARSGRGVDLGEGAIISDFVMLTADLKIGRHFHANIYSYVAHDCEIGDFVTLAPRVCINGNTIIEDDAYIGTGAVLKQGTPDKPLQIGKGAVIGMGAVVTKDVPPGVTVIGNPARPLDR